MNNGIMMEILIELKKQTKAMKRIFKMMNEWKELDDKQHQERLNIMKSKDAPHGD